MNYFIRNYELDSTLNALKLYQKTEGDVSCVVWDAAIVLAKYLERKTKINQSFLENQHVIELGAGVGCVGITAACYGYVFLNSFNITSQMIFNHRRN